MHSFASLAIQAVGIKVSVISTMLMAIQRMKFHLRTGYGDSITNYKSEPDIPYQGICQGNGASPAIWLLISSFIILLLKEKQHNIQIRSAFTSLIISYVTLMFVDDGDFPTISRESTESIQNVITRHQHTVECWYNGLRVLGGALQPKKCFWYPIEWIWKNGIAKIASSHHCKRNIMVPDSQQSMKKINCLEATESREVMGVWKTPTGNMKRQIENLENKVSEWMSMLKNGYLRRPVIWRAFWGTIWMAIRYTLPTLSITKSQGEWILRPLYKQFLPKIGVSHVLPLAFRYGSLEHYGLGLPQIQIESLIAKLFFYVMHNGINTLPGKHLQVSAEYVQMEIGVSQQFFLLPFSKYGFMASRCWLTSLWSEVSQTTGLMVKYRMPGIPTPPRINDEFLMEKILLLQRYTKEQLISINRQRLYLHIMFLSEITTGSGTHISKTFFEREIKPRKSSYCWPKKIPTRQDFTLWCEALYLISISSR